MTTPSSRAASSPTSASRRAVSFAESPASTSTRVRPAQMSTALPVEQLPKTVSLISYTRLENMPRAWRLTQTPAREKVLLVQDELRDLVTAGDVEVALRVEGERVHAVRGLE